MFKKTLFLTTALVLVMGLSLPVSAQETTTSPPTTAVENGQVLPSMTAQDLGINGTSWFHNIWRDVRIFFTRDPIKKSKLELQKASLQLLKAKQMTEKNPQDEKLQQRLEKINQKYEQIMQRVNSRLEKIKAQRPNDEHLNKFLDQYTDSWLKHQEMLENLATRLPGRASQAIQTARQTQLRHFNQVMQRLEDKKRFTERLQETLLDKKDNIKRRAVRYGIIKKLEEIDPEIKKEVEKKMEELKPEAENLLKKVKETHQQIMENRQELRKKIEEQLKEINKDEPINNPAARRQLRQEIQGETRNLRQENREIEKETRQNVREFRQKVRDGVDEIRDKIKQK